MGRGRALIAVATAAARVAACGLRLRLRLGYRAGRRRCARSAVRATLRGADLSRVRVIVFRSGSRPVARDRRRPFSRRIPLRRLRRRDATVITAVATTADGSRVPVEHRVRRCRAR